ncbi:nucleotidyltransferase family protein [Qipengyuania nanhaisediminis]|uniref:nucleotidyltransferase family protein n=1 Tax=Qipengyuania nanhaisediminis TaxID=604088 RepID=UPI0038B3D6E0
MDQTSINGFLASTLRRLRAGDRAPWPEQNDASWQDVWARIEYHGIVMLLHSHAQALTGWPPRLLERIAEEARLIGLWESTHRALIAEAVEALAQAGIASVMMKGTALAYAFHADPADRRRGDSDLLIRPEDADKARTTLAALGWHRRDDPHGLNYQEGWLHPAAGFFEHAIDLHWQPSDRPVLRSRLPQSDFFVHRVALPRLSPNASRPATSTMLLHAAINQKWHREHGYFAESGRVTGARRLIWSVDFDLLAAAMNSDDWETLAARCEKRRCAALVAEALDGATRDLGTSVPPDVARRLACEPLDRDLAILFGSRDPVSQFLLDLRTADWGERLRLVRYRGLPPRKHLLTRYPQARNWPTALLQIRWLADSARRALRKAAAQ